MDRTAIIAIGIIVYVGAMIWALWPLSNLKTVRKHIPRTSLGVYLLLALLFPTLGVPLYLLWWLGVAAPPASWPLAWLGPVWFTPMEVRLFYYAARNEIENRQRLETGEALAADIEYKFEIKGEAEPRTVTTTVHCFDRAFSELELHVLHHFPNFTTAVADEFVYQLSDDRFVAVPNERLCWAHQG